MPFRSEKQRRFLWAKHPDIAKEWAHKYPESNKNLPMYVKDDKDKTPEKAKSMSKAAMSDVLRRILVNNSRINEAINSWAHFAPVSKSADSKLEQIKMPQSDEPSAAGERKIESILKPETEDEGSIGQEKSEQVPQHAGNNCSNPLLSKLGAVLAPKIQQELENIKAQQQARDAQRIPQNANVKQYPVVNNMIPPPMGMTAPPQQAPAQPQQQTQQPGGQMAPVGGGMSPNANPINAFGGLSTRGDINGNAAMGTQNMAGGEKMAYGVWDEYGVAERTPYYNFKPADKLPAYLTRASELAAQKGYRLGFTNERYGESIPGKEYAEKLLKGKLPTDYFDNEFPAFFDMHPMDTRSWWQKMLGKKYQDPKYTIDDLHGHNIDDDKEWQKHVDENWPVYRAYKEIYETPQPVGKEKAAWVTGFADGAFGEAMKAAPIVGGGLGALAGGAIGGIHGAVAPGEYTDSDGNKKKRSRILAALRGGAVGAGIGGLGGAAAGAVGAVPNWDTLIGQNKPVFTHKGTTVDYDDLGTGLLSGQEKKNAAAQKCSCGCGQKVHECTCPPSCSCRQKGGSCHGLKKQAGAGVGRAIGRAAEEQGVDPTTAALIGLAGMGALYGTYYGGKKLLTPLAKRMSVSTLAPEHVGPVAVPAEGGAQYTFAERYREPSMLGGLFIDSDTDAITNALQHMLKKRPDALARLESEASIPADLDIAGKYLVSKYPNRYRLPTKQASGGNCPALGKIMDISGEPVTDPAELDELESEMFDKTAFEFGALVCGYMDKQAMPRGLQHVPSGAGPDQIEDAILRYNQLRALVRPDDNTLKQYGLKRPAFQQALRKITSHSQDKDRFELRKVAPNPGLHAAVAGISSLALPAAAGYFGGPQAALATLPISGAAAGAAYVNASMKREGVKRTAKLLKQYGLLNPQLLRQAYPLLGDDYRIA